MDKFAEHIYLRIKSIISTWSETDIYAISFFVYSNESYQYNNFSNVPYFAIGYNTENDCKGAGIYDEVRWNYAFWRHNEKTIIDPNNPDELLDMLFQWYEENGITDIGYEDLDCYDEKGNYIGKGPVGHYELLQIVCEVAKRLQQERFVEECFDKKIPIIIHGLEYAWYDIEATKSANMNGEASVYLEALKEQGIIS